MAPAPHYPSLLQTRVWLERLSPQSWKTRHPSPHRRRHRRRLCRERLRVDLAAERLADRRRRQSVSRGNPQLRAEFQAVLSDLTEEDICGSGFAITAYTVDGSLGGK